MMMLFVQVAVTTMVLATNAGAQSNRMEAKEVNESLALLEKELDRNQALFKSLSAHIELQKQQRESLYRQQRALAQQEDREALLYTNESPHSDAVRPHMPDDNMLRDVCRPLDDDPTMGSMAQGSLPVSNNSWKSKGQPQSVALKKALASLSKKYFPSAYQALMALSNQTKLVDFPLVLYWLGMMDLYINQRPDLAARWFSKAYLFWEKSTTNPEKIFCAYIVLHLSRALIQQNKKEDARVVLDQYAQCIQTIKDRPKKLTQMADALYLALSNPASARPISKPPTHNAAPSAVPYNAHVSDDEDDQYSPTAG